MTEHNSTCAVWLYTRSKNKSISALVDQMQRLLKEAERRGYTVVGTSQAQYNGYGIHRTGLKLMMEAVRSGIAHVVVVWNLSRMGKDNKTLFRILSFLKDHDSVLITMSTDLRYELSVRDLELPLRKRAFRKGRDVPW